nr:hypothetical protein [Tanacetum cinerariifolium]
VQDPLRLEPQVVSELFEWTLNKKNTTQDQQEGPTNFALMDYTSQVNETETSTSKTSKESLEKPKTVRPSAPIIEEWESDSEDENVVEKTKYTCKQKRQLNGIREEKSVWNNAGRVNHQNSPRITHPNLKRHMVPRKILTRPKAVINAVRMNQVNDAKSSAC